MIDILIKAKGVIEQRAKAEISHNLTEEILKDLKKRFLSRIADAKAKVLDIEKLIKDFGRQTD